MASAQMILCGLLAAGFWSVHAHVTVRGGRAFLETNMQPEVVARTLRNVEEEWKAQASVFAQCNSTAADGSSVVDCKDAPASFFKSCGIVVGAIVQGSNGNKHVAKEYIADVCGQSVLEGWHKTQCFGLAQSVSGAMTADSYDNRYNFDSKKLCTNFWSSFLKEEQKRLAEEKVAREAAEKKAAEEEKAAREAAEKKAQEEAAEAARKDEEEKKAEAARKKIEQAAKEKAEAEAKAKAAAEKMAKKKAEAEAVAKAAQQKVDEAKQAEKENQEALAKLQKSKKAPVEKDSVKLADANAVASAAEPKKSDVKPVNASPAKKEEKPAAVVKAPATVEKAKSAAAPAKAESAVAPTKPEKPVAVNNQTAQAVDGAQVVGTADQQIVLGK